jgi:hypothetical protein
MTNFDVIESYTEDFSKYPWYNKTERYVGNLTSKALTVTEVLVRSALIYTSIKPYNFKVRITGLINNQKVIFGDDTSQYRALIVDKDGIYDINWEDNHRAYCIWMDFIGECNITITQLPTSILKDFSGNGNHAYLYGGKGKLNSGMGVYEVDFTTYYGDVINSYTGRLASNNKKNLGIAYHKLTKDIEPYTVKVTGIRKEVVRFVYRNEEGIEKDILIKNDGYYTVPKCYKDGTQGSSTAFVLFANYDNDTEVIIEQIPDYPDQLCYDGKMYAVAYDMPILTDYTIITDRTWFKDKINSWSYFVDKKRAFVFERTGNGKSFNVMSFAAETAIELQKDGVSYQTKTSYNGNAINYHSDQADNDDMLVIGSTKDSLGNQCFIGCHSDILIFNRTLTEYEISWVKNNMMCSKQQEPDIDL